MTQLDASVAQAKGPASSTRTTELESEDVPENAQELSKWLSVVEDQLEDVSELTSIPSLQGLLERMESQAGRVVANELSAALTDGECHQLDELGRERLR